MAKSKLEIRFVNRSGRVAKFPNPRGGRTALAPGEWVTDEYFRRFSRLASEPNKNNKPLVQEYPDGTPVGVDDLPEGDDSVIVAPVQEPKVARAPVSKPSASGCETSCESACQFDAQSNPTTVDDINREMDKNPEPASAPPLTGNLTEDSQSPPPSPVSGTMQQSPPQQQTLPSTPQAPVQGSMQQPQPAPAPAPSATSSAPPAPTINENIQGTRVSLDQIKAHFQISDEQILEQKPDYFVLDLNGEKTFASRIELGWNTTHEPAMKAHITKNT